MTDGIRRKEVITAIEYSDVDAIIYDKSNHLKKTIIEAYTYQELIAIANHYNKEYVSRYALQHKENSKVSYVETLSDIFASVSTDFVNYINKLSALKGISFSEGLSSLFKGLDSIQIRDGNDFALIMLSFTIYYAINEILDEAEAIVKKRNPNKYKEV